MKQYAEDLEFEKAQVIKERLNFLENYQSKSTIVNPKINNADVFSIITDPDFGLCELFESGERSYCSITYGGD